MTNHLNASNVRHANSCSPNDKLTDSRAENPKAFSFTTFRNG
jgi:hypothetical protein